MFNNMNAEKNDIYNPVNTISTVDYVYNITSICSRPPTHVTPYTTVMTVCLTTYNNGGIIVINNTTRNNATIT